VAQLSASHWSKNRRHSQTIPHSGSISSQSLEQKQKTLTAYTLVSNHQLEQKQKTLTTYITNPHQSGPVSSQPLQLKQKTLTTYTTQAPQQSIPVSS
jgi:hypothetical protein